MLSLSVDIWKQLLPSESRVVSKRRKSFCTIIIHRILSSSCSLLSFSMFFSICYASTKAQCETQRFIKCKMSYTLFAVFQLNYSEKLTLLLARNTGGFFYDFRQYAMLTFTCHHENVFKSMTYVESCLVLNNLTRNEISTNERGYGALLRNIFVLQSCFLMHSKEEVNEKSIKFYETLVCHSKK